MHHTIHNQVSDDDLKHAYRSRFRAKVGDTLNNSHAVADHLFTYFNGRTTEAFAVIFLNARNAIIATEIMFEGTVNTAAVYPREIIKRALELHAVSIIIGHNHPSGQLVDVAPRRQELYRDQLTPRSNLIIKSLGLE